MKTAYQRKETSIISRIHQLQPKVHQELFQQSNIFDQFYDKRQALIMRRKRTKRIQSTTASVHYRFSIEDVRHREISTIENRRIRSSYRDLHQSETR